MTAKSEGNSSRTLRRVDRLTRPLPPANLLAPDADPVFLPAPDLALWLGETFIAPSAPLTNPDHAHLVSASLACLWTNVPYTTKMRRAAATAERPTPPAAASTWSRARWAQQLREWFGATLPDFILTFDATFCADLDPASWCSVCEHELYHCGQAENEYGPRFRKDGTPVFAIRGHTAEEFSGTVRRYGVGAASSGVAELVAAAQRIPEIAPAAITAVCGTCLRRAA